MRRIMTRLKITLLGAVCLELTACTQYINRYVERVDTINFSAGDAVAANEALMVPDPWPRHAYDTNIAFDGERMARAAQIYREGLKQPIETLAKPRGDKQFGSKFIDSGTGLPQRQPGKDFFVPVQETNTGLPNPPPPSVNVNQNSGGAPPTAAPGTPAEGAPAAGGY
jgi:hypothetical protein